MMHPLAHAVFKEMLARLELVALKPKRILAMGCGDLQAHYPNAEIFTTLADVPENVDLIIANLQWYPDVQHEWRKLLRPEGLLMFTAYGPNTLSEIEDPLFNLPSLMDMHNIGDALVQAGFADPVLDVDHFEIKYQNKEQLLADLGVTQCNTATLSLSYEIVYGHAWCPESNIDFVANAEGEVNIPLAALRAQLRK